MIPNLRDFGKAEASPKSLLHILIGRCFIPRTVHVAAYKMSPHMTGFTPNYREDIAVKINFLENRIFVLIYKIDELVKSSKTVMPDLIRHPEVIGFTGFRLSPE